MPIIYSNLVVQGDVISKGTFTRKLLTTQSKDYIETNHLSFEEGSVNRFNLAYNENKSGIYNKNGILYFNVEGDNKISLNDIQLTVDVPSEFNEVAYFNNNVIFKNLIPGVLTDLDVSNDGIVINITGKYYTMVSGMLSDDDIIYTNGQYFKVKDNDEMYNTGTASNSVVERILRYDKTLEQGYNRVSLNSYQNEIALFLPPIETIRVCDTIQLYLENSGNSSVIKIKTSGLENIIDKRYLNVSIDSKFTDITFIRSYENRWLIY